MTMNIQIRIRIRANYSVGPTLIEYRKNPSNSYQWTLDWHQAALAIAAAAPSLYTRHADCRAPISTAVSIYYSQLHTSSTYHRL